MVVQALQQLNITLCPLAEDLLSMNRSDIARMITREESFIQAPVNQQTAHLNANVTSPLTSKIDADVAW